MRSNLVRLGRDWTSVFPCCLDDSDNPRGELCVNRLVLRHHGHDIRTEIGSAQLHPGRNRHAGRWRLARTSTRRSPAARVAETNACFARWISYDVLSCINPPREPPARACHTVRAIRAGEPTCAPEVKT